MTRLVRFPVLLFALLLVVTGCDSSADPGPTTSSTTTTTIDNDTCDRVEADTVAYLEVLIDTLDSTRLEELLDEEAWGSDLRDVQRAGKDLDLRVGALRCDPAAIQRRAFADADLVPAGPLSARLLQLLLSPTTSTTTVEPTTSTVAPPSSTTTTGGG